MVFVRDTKIAGHVFARLVGGYTEGDTLLFEVAREFVDEAETNGWHGPVEYRFVRREGAFVELEFHALDPNLSYREITSYD